ncbi:MAG: GNAT family N-acetyltransferase [Planctomycetota bacterium]
MGVAPLTITHTRRFGLRTRTVEFIGTSYSDYLDVIAGAEKPDVLAAVYAHLWSLRDRWDTVRLRGIPQTSATLGLSESWLQEHRIAYQVGADSTCPVILLEGQGEQAVRQGFLRHGSLRNLMNQLKRLGELSYARAADEAEGQLYLDVFFQQHLSRWESTLTPSVFYEERERAFYRHLIESLLPAGWLHLGHLDLNGQPIAMFVGFEYNRSLALHRPAHVSAYSRYSPGRQIIYYAVQYCVEKGLRDFDLLAGVEGYKGQMANAERQNCFLHIHKSRGARSRDLFAQPARRSRLGAPLFQSGWGRNLRMKFRKYRRRYGTWGLMKRLLHRAVSPMLDYSVNQVSIACRTSNSASIRGILKAGFARHRRIHAVRLLGRKLCAQAVRLG